MLNIIWPIIIVLSYLFAIFSGNIEKLNNGIFESVNSAVELVISIVGMMCLWSGIMQIASKTTIIDKISKLLYPIMAILFPKLKKNKDAISDMSMNIIANLLGLGNAATPLGIKAMKTLQKDNKNKSTITNEMCMFIVINTASIQLIPTMLIAIRSAAGSNSPASIMIPIWITSFIALISGVCIVKLFSRRKNEII